MNNPSIKLTEQLVESTNSSGTHLGSYIVFVSLVVATVYFSHLLRGSIITESALALAVGIAAGAGFFVYFEMVRGMSIPKHLVRFKYELYMDILLPPIIFNAGYNMKKKDFFSNFSVLLLLGVCGTFVSTAFLAALCSLVLQWLDLDQHELVGNSLVLGAVFSSTDSVAALQVLNQEALPRLYSLVFGEAVTNDATSVVLFRSIQHIRRAGQLNLETLSIMLLRFMWLFTGSLILGVTIGLLSAFLIKRSFQGRECAHEREVSLLALLGFLSYLLAEQLQLSGIFSAFFCGLAISHWTYHSLSPEAKVSSLYGFRTLAFVAENLLFLSAGLDMWTTSLWRKELYTKGIVLRKTLSLAAALTALVPGSRLLVVGPIIWINNWCRPPSARLSLGETAALWWAGCMRGAVTVALAVNHFAGGAQDGAQASIQNQIIGEACMVAVVISTVIFGGITGNVLQYLLGETPREAVQVNGLGSIGGKKNWWGALDKKYLQPVFGGRGQLDRRVSASAAWEPLLE